MPDGLQSRKAEFEAHIWNHADDVFQKSFDLAPPLRPTEIASFDALIDALDAGEDDQQLSLRLRTRLTTDPALMNRLLQLFGLTRNKILQDLKALASARETRVRIPASATSLTTRNDLWALAGPYLQAWTRKTLAPLTAYPDRTGALQALNEATWSGYIRQERAKRQGHEAEGRIARMLLSLRIPFEPEDKAENPLGRDAQIAGVSFDIVSPSTANPFLVIKSTVQTANIGQFGESKTALEIEEAQRVLGQKYGEDRPTLTAFVDGVGFRSNAAGLEGALMAADEFAQFRTLWKIEVIAAAGIGERITVALPDGHAQAHASFLDAWSGSVLVEALTPEFRAQLGEVDLVDAGEALVRPEF